jgi:uncharacterized protein YggE
MRRRTPLVVLLVIALTLSALLVAGCSSAAAPGAAKDSVTASGSGTVHAAPDEADMTFGVTTSNANAKAALNGASKAASELSAALEKAGIAKEDIQTQNVSVYPDYANNSSRPTITGYTASISVQATVRDIGKLGDVINAANSAGSDSISGPSFTISDDSALYGQAIEKAVADARKRAEAMAKAAGKTVGTVLSISEAPVAVSPGPFYDVARAAQASVPISLGQLDVTANVTVVYELK